MSIGNGSNSASQAFNNDVFDFGAADFGANSDGHSQNSQFDFAPAGHQSTTPDRPRTDMTLYHFVIDQEEKGCSENSVVERACSFYGGVKRGDIVSLLSYRVQWPLGYEHAFLRAVKMVDKTFWEQVCVQIRKQGWEPLEGDLDDQWCRLQALQKLPRSN